MSFAGKRMPKRSILGSRVAVKGVDGWWKKGVVVAMKTDEGGTSQQRFSVKMDGERIACEYGEVDIIGPAFQSSIPGTQSLEAGQGVYITHQGREVAGVVVKHDMDQDQVVVAIAGVGKVEKRLEEVRILESRKSSRLVNNDTDFSRLADFNIVEQRKKLIENPPRRRLYSAGEGERRRRASDLDRRKAEAREERKRMKSDRGLGGQGGDMGRRVSTGSASIDVPLMVNGSRKRRTSESRSELESGYSSSQSSGMGVARSWGGPEGGEKITDCTAAMVLMRLSASPKEKGLWRDYSFSPVDSCSDSSTSSHSPASHSPPYQPPTPAPSPSLSLSNLYQGEDEEPCKRSKPSHVVFECTWRGCKQREDTQRLIERHVRGHLGRPEPGPHTVPDYEEEFYYTEIDMDDDILDIMEAIPEQIDMQYSNREDCHFQMYKTETNQSDINIPESKPIDNEDASNVEHILVESTKTFSQSSSCPASLEAPRPLPLTDHLDMARPAHEAPTIIFVNRVNTLTVPTSNVNKTGTKFIQIFPRPGSSQEKSSQQMVFKTGTGRSVLRTEKKCRKVYGIEQKELWCTQCKWKKACARFQDA